MHSATLDSTGSPKKRMFSRGLSEDESLRSIIQETESSSRRLARSDSRAGAPKRRSDSQETDQDLFMGLPEMLELQANYEEVVQELRGLEVEREALLFQVDVLQDTLEGVEELLAEAQREAGQASLELEQEREAKKKLESLVCSLMQEVERLKEEQSNKLSVPANTHRNEETRQGPEMKYDATELTEAAHGEEKDSSLSEPHSSDSVGQVFEELQQGVEGEENILTKLRRMVAKTHIPSLAVDILTSGEGVLQRPYENCVDYEQDRSLDTNDVDSISAYEDALADTPEQDRIFPGDGDSLDLLDDSESKEKNLANDNKNQDPRSADLCVVS
uniref:leucine-rich repeat flightless-interacting protein 2 n=1 Tax=Monopterus albus TaxID=43700 RepID=UPI0009B3BB60|nr:leucine-rich repeat flightless-interacting protein 2-like [Monopterus albus]